MTYDTYAYLIVALVVLWIVVFAITVVIWSRVWRLLRDYKRAHRGQELT